MNPERPEFVGKYIGLSNIRFVYEILVKNRLYFSNPAQFNDPFEMIPAILPRKIFKSVSPVRKKKLSEDVLSQIYQDSMRKFRDEQSKVLTKFGVSCLSQSFDDIVMWSHYADQHKGICILFDTKLKFFDGLRPVTYVPKRLPTPIKTKGEPGRLMQLMTTKLDLWEYEKEWRMFRRFKDKGYRFPKTAVYGVVFGDRCTPEDRDIVTRMVDPNRVKLFTASLSLYEYKLILTQIEA
tara:strand:+ start:1402 stop:2112 length:711 start_codon:yes stop_codon:yes gene_type:complete